MEINLRARKAVMDDKHYLMQLGVQRIMCASMVPMMIGLKYPAGVFVYWIGNNCFSMAQIWLLNQPAVRSRFGLPPLQNTFVSTTQMQPPPSM